MEYTVNPINKYIFEILTVSSGLVYISVVSDNTNLIGDAVLIFAAMFRIFPSFNKILTGLQKLNIHKKSFNNIHKLYYEKSDRKLPNNEIFFNKIDSFSFTLNKVEIDKSKYIKNLNISFYKKDKIILIRGVEAG